MCIHTSGFSAPTHVSRLKLIFKSLETYSLLQKLSWGTQLLCQFVTISSLMCELPHTRYIQEHKRRGGCSWGSCNKMCLLCSGFTHILLSYATCKTTEGPQPTWLYVGRSQPWCTDKQDDLLRQKMVRYIKYDHFKLVCTQWHSRKPWGNELFVLARHATRTVC